MKIHYLQHDPAETPGSIIDWANRRGHSVSGSLLYQDQPLPELGAFDWLVVMGGPMNVYEEERYPWLVREKDFIRRAVEAGKTAIGFCLGGQLLACVLGGAVSKNSQPEIGWLPVRWKPAALQNPLFSFFPPEITVLQWHGDTFSVLPPGAELLADSEACGHQAFIYRENVFAFQFHLETTLAVLRRFTEDFGADMPAGPYVQTATELLGRPECVRQSNLWLEEFLCRLEKKGGC